jgi:hypothetical protein
MLPKVLDTGMYKKNYERAKTPNKARQLCFFCTALLFNEIYLSIKFRDDICYSFSYVPGKNEQRAITPKLDKAMFRFLSIAVLSNEIYLPTKFHVDISNSFSYVPYKSKSKNKQRVFNQVLGQAELRFLCNAHLLNEIYLPTKFHVDTSYSLSYVLHKVWQ